MTLSTEQQILIEQRVTNDARSPVVAYLLLIFLGGFAAHRFYLGRMLSAIVLLILFWVGVFLSGIFIGLPLLMIAGLWLLVDLFLIPGMIREDKDAIRARLTAAGTQSE